MDSLQPATPGYPPPPPSKAPPPPKAPPKKTGAATKGFSSFLGRFFSASVLVFATYNPTGFSYFHWALKPLYLRLTTVRTYSQLLQVSQEDSLKAFAGVILVIAWLLYARFVRPTYDSFGMTIAIAFFGSLIWVLNAYKILPYHPHSTSYVTLSIVSLLLATGARWKSP